MTQSESIIDCLASLAVAQSACESKALYVFCDIRFAASLFCHLFCRFAYASLRVIARRNDRHCEERSKAIQKTSYNKSYKSSQLGFMPSIKASFAALEPPLICFSLSIASFIETCSL